MKLIEEPVNVQILAGEDGDLDVFGPVLKPPFAVGEASKPDIEQPRVRAAFCKFRVGEKAGFDVARTRHVLMLSLFSTDAR